MELRIKGFWLFIGFGFVLLVAYLSLTPDRPDLDIPQGMKIGHVLAYAWLMLWYAQIYQAGSTRCRLAAMFCLMGIGLEYLQGLTDYRSFEYSDMVLNSAGVAIGFLLGYTPLQYGLRTLENTATRRPLPKS